MAGIDQDRSFSDLGDGDVLEYRAISMMAVAGLLVALLSGLAFWHPVVWTLPVASAILCLLALARIKRSSPMLLGRSLALVGLWLSLVLLVAAPTQYGVVMWRSRYTARTLAENWFAALAEARPDRALQLLYEPDTRQASTVDLWMYYRQEINASANMRLFVEDPIVRALLELGPQAQVRYLGCEVQHTSDLKERLNLLYAVTYEKQGQPTSFIVRLLLEREASAPRNTNDWQLLQYALLDHPPRLCPELAQSASLGNP